MAVVIFFFCFCSRFPLFDSVGFIKCVNLLLKNDEIKNRKESTFSARRMVSPIRHEIKADF
jgi:hypothetical protein